MIARAIAGGAVNDLAANDLDRIIGEDVVDANGRALVLIDEVGGNRVAPPRRWDGILDAEIGQGGEYKLSAFDESVDSGFGVG